MERLSSRTCQNVSKLGCRILASVLLSFCPSEDGEGFQPGRDYVYFIVKGEVEIWKASASDRRCWCF